MNIDVENGLIEAKSEHENYVDEASGIKPNTQRIVDEVEAGMLRALQTAVKDEHKPVTIVLKKVGETDPGSKPESVRRPVTNIKFMGEECGFHKVTISWRHVSMEEPA